jgi:hypothetical protein
MVQARFNSARDLPFSSQRVTVACTIEEDFHAPRINNDRSAAALILAISDNDHPRNTSMCLKPHQEWEL